MSRTYERTHAHTHAGTPQLVEEYPALQESSFFRGLSVFRVRGGSRQGPEEVGGNAQAPEKDEAPAV